MNLSSFYRLFLVATLPISFSAQAESQGLSDKIKAATVDMPVTTAPSSFLLGASGETVPRLSSFRSFSAQVARAYDDKGKISNAVAVELAPLLAMGTTTWEDITRSQITRILSRTTLSFGSKVGNNDNNGQSAIGVQSILYSKELDGAIALAATSQCSTATQMSPTDPPPEPPKKLPDLGKDVLDKIEACQGTIDALLTKWNQSMVSVGVGRVFTSSDNVSTIPSRDPFAFWVTAAYGGDFANRKTEPVETRNGYLLTTHFRAVKHSAVISTGGIASTADAKLIGLNGRFGNARLAGIVEYSVTSFKGGELDFDNRKRGLLGLEYKVDKDVYLTIGIARDTGLDVSKQSVLAKLNFGISKTPAIFSGK
jgi:hypothetical protein